MAIDLKNIRIEVVGNPDFWQTANAVNPAGFLVVHALGPLYAILRSKPVKGKLPVAIGRMMSVTFKSLHAVVNLTLNGFDTDGMRIARSMFENEVISDYLRKHPDLVDDYNDFLYASMQEELDFLLEKAPDLLAQQPAGFVENAKTQLAAAAKFRTKSGKLKNSWKDVSIKQMAEETGRADAYRTIYRWGSGLMHGDVTSIVANFDLDAGDIDVGPSTKWTHTALRTAHNAMLCLMTDFNEEAKLGFDADIEKAVRAFRETWEPELWP